jgi:hypothetical protein
MGLYISIPNQDYPRCPLFHTFSGTLALWRWHSFKNAASMYWKHTSLWDQFFTPNDTPREVRQWDEGKPLTRRVWAPYLWVKDILPETAKEPAATPEAGEIHLVDLGYDADPSREISLREQDPPDPSPWTS